MVWPQRRTANKGVEFQVRSALLARSFTFGVAQMLLMNGRSSTTHQLAVTVLVIVLPTLVAVSNGWAQTAENSISGDRAEQSQSKNANDRSQESPTQPSQAQASVVRLVLTGAMTESVESAGLFGELQRNLRQAIYRIDQASIDDDVDAVVLRIRGLQIGRGKLNELRKAVGRLRHHGKAVIADVHFAMPADYLVATACDKIVMPESGSLVLPGIRAEVTFYKDLFDKVGLQADMLQVGDFKGAAEPYTRSKMSEAFRRQYERVVDELYDQMVDTIAEARQLKRKDVEQRIDQGLFMAAAAQKAGLIDVVAYDDGYEDELKAMLGVAKVQYLKNYAKKKVDTDFSGMSGMFRFFEMMTGGAGKTRSSDGQKIAVVYAVGAIMTGKSTSDLFGVTTLGSDTLVAALRKAEEDDTVAGIVLRIDSPGGSALASDLIWHQVQRCRKPVVASMGDVAASGGYYVAMGCDKILAEPGTITGSIGVVGGKIVMGGLMNKLGVTTDVISRGRNVGIFSSTSAFTPTEREAFQASMLTTYEQFTQKAAAGRGMDLDRLKSLAGGRIWTGRQAQENGLVDEIGTLHDAIRISQRLAGVKGQEQPEILVLPKPRTFFEQLLEPEDDEVRTRRVSDLTTEALVPEIWQAYRLFHEPVLTWLPYRVTIH